MARNYTDESTIETVSLKRLTHFVALKETAELGYYVTMGNPVQIHF